MSQVIEVHNDTELAAVLEEGYVLMDFYATWCGPCKMLAPGLEALAEERNDIKVVKFDVDKSENFASQMSVMSVPTLMLFNHGQKVADRVGFAPKEAISDWIDSSR